MDGFVDSSKRWLLVIMVNSPVAMENEDAFLFSLLTVAAIDTVVWTVVPLAGEHIHAFCNTDMIIIKIVNNWVCTNPQIFVYVMVNVQKTNILLVKSCLCPELMSFMATNNSVYVVAQTWVMVKYDIKKVLVTPGDIEFILLEKGHQNFLPLKCNCCQVILEGQIWQSRAYSYNFT